MNTKAPEIITKFYDFLLYLVPKISKFPKSQKYLLGDRLETISLSILENLIEAVYSREKLPLLLRSNIQLEKLRYLFRLSKDLKLLDLHTYEVASKMLYDLGNQLGGWIKQQRARQ